MSAYKRLVYHISGWIWRRELILGASLFLYQGILVCAFARRAETAFWPYSLFWDGDALTSGLWAAALLLLIDLTRYLSAAHRGIDSLAIVPAPRWAAPLAEFTVAAGGLLFLAAVQNLAALAWYPLARWVMADTALMMGGGADAPITNGLYLAFVRSSNLRKTLPLTQWGVLGAIVKLGCFGAAALAIPRAGRYVALLRAPAELPRTQTDTACDDSPAHREDHQAKPPRPSAGRTERVKPAEPRKASPDNVKKRTRTRIFAGALCAAFVLSYGYVFAASGWGMVEVDHLDSDPAVIADMTFSFEIADDYHRKNVTIENGTIRQSTRYLQNALVWRSSSLWWAEPYWIELWNEPWRMEESDAAIEIRQRAASTNAEPFFAIDSLNGARTGKKVLQLDGAVLVVTHYNGCLELWLLEETGERIGEYRLPGEHEYAWWTIGASWSDDVLCLWGYGYENWSGLRVLRPENGEMREVYTSETVPDYAAYIDGKIVTLYVDMQDAYSRKAEDEEHFRYGWQGRKAMYPYVSSEFLEPAQIKIHVRDETGEIYLGAIDIDAGEDLRKYNNTRLHSAPVDYWNPWGRDVERQIQNIRVEGTR